MPKPVILSVDDDPEVLSAIERDLRQHFRSDYRIIKSGSPAQALETVAQLNQRGAAIALFLVDQRMPGMSGTELLKEAVKLQPEAVKVLLTAYADTEAAIDSINEIGLDHYLMKPWDPPEEKLFPILDDLLSKWTMRVRLPYDGIRVAGAKWSPQSYEVKEFLSRNQVPYQWIDIDHDEAMKLSVAKLTGETQKLPVVLFPDGEPLIAPTIMKLAERVGLKTKANLPFYDLVIVGGGPAGLANAVYGASEGLRTLLVEQAAPGGQAGTSSRIENYLGFPAGITGADLAQRATAQARRFGAEILTAQSVTGITRDDPYRVISLSDGSKISCYAVLISSGMSVNMLSVLGIESLLGIGVYYGAAMTEAATYRGQNVCIVGGANSAGQGALFFARYAKHVTMIARRETLNPPMSQYLVDRIKATPNITALTRAQVNAIHGTNRLERVVIENLDTSEQNDLDVSAMFIFIGAAPRSHMVAGLVERDEKGFVFTGPDLPRINGSITGWTLDRDPLLFETNVPGIFAAGDVRAGANRRVAAAVGEGSAAIHTIIKYLETV